MNIGTGIALGVGALLLLSRQQAAAQQAAAAASPVAAAANGISSLEKSLLSALSPKASAPKSSGGAGGNPAGGVGSGRSAGGTTPVIPVEDAFPNFNGPSVIPTPAGGTGAAFQPGGIFSDPTQFAGNQPDLSATPAPDPTAENSLIDSMVSTTSVPVFDPGPDPSVPVPIDPSVVDDGSGDF